MTAAILVCLTRCVINRAFRATRSGYKSRSAVTARVPAKSFCLSSAEALAARRLHAFHKTAYCTIVFVPGNCSQTCIGEREIVRCRPPHRAATLQQFPAKRWKKRGDLSPFPGPPNRKRSEHNVNHCHDVKAPPCRYAIPQSPPRCDQY
jgi:hypothetical protein